MKRTPYSVWDNDKMRYDYYVGRDVGSRPPPAGPSLQLGAPPETAAMRLPFGARYVGSGEEAVGRIAEPGVDLREIGRLALLGLAVFGAWMLWKRWRKR